VAFIVAWGGMWMAPPFLTCSAAPFISLYSLVFTEGVCGPGSCGPIHFHSPTARGPGHPFLPATDLWPRRLIADGLVLVLTTPISAASEQRGNLTVPHTSSVQLHNCAIVRVVISSE